MMPFTDIDEAIRKWLRYLLETHSKREISAWMGYGGESGGNPSRSQLDGYLRRDANRHFKAAYIAGIAAGLGITSGEALLQIFAELPRGHRSSPLPGRSDREDARASAQRALTPQGSESKSAK